MATHDGWPMLPAQLLTQIREENRLGLGASLADELALHLPPMEEVFGQLCLRSDVEQLGYGFHGGEVSIEVWLVLTERHILHAQLEQGSDGGRPRITVGSGPLGRLRGVKTSRGVVDRSTWSLEFDFAGPMFGDESVSPLRLHCEGDGPSPEARAFLAALASVRR